MSYRIGRDETVGAAIRRIGCEQIEKALSELAQKGEPAEWRIHQLRKRCKKLRALARLVRPGFDGYREANKRFRDIARLVSDERDARVMSELVDDLIDEDDDLEGGDEPLARWFALHCEIAEKLAEPVLGEIDKAMSEAAVEIEQWDLADLTIDDAVAGLGKTLGRAHDELASVRENGGVSDFHNWRKRCKYHWYHLRLLEDVMEDGGDERREAFDDLGDLVGDSHDRSVLIEKLHELPGFMRRDKAVQRIEAEAIRERRKLRREALEAAGPVFDVPPGEFAEAVGRHWKTLAESG